jgi:dTDP-glucose 4,6-dehydratase
MGNKNTIPNTTNTISGATLNTKKLDNHDKVLITGGCGAIGGCVVNYFKSTYPDTYFVNIDAITYCAKRENIELPYDNYKLYEGDICDVDFVMKVLNTEKPTLIIHLAAETHVDQSFGNSFKFTQTNIMGTHVLLECMRHYNDDKVNVNNRIKLFIHMSTDEVYGSVNDGEICTEQSIFAPSNPYSATKAGAEMLCHAFIKSFNLPIIIVRCNNAVSPHQHDEKLIPQCIYCITNNKKINVHGEGKAKRTFIHATDIARALNCIALKGEIGEIYNIGSKMEYTVIEVIREVLEQLKPGDDYKKWIKYVPDRAFQDYRYYIDSTKLYNLGWKDQISFKDAVADVIKYKKKI